MITLHFFIQLAIVAVVFNVFRTIKVDKLLSKLLQQPDIYADFEFLAFWQTQYNNMNAVNLFFAWIKVRTNKIVGQIIMSIYIIEEIIP